VRPGRSWEVSVGFYHGRHGRNSSQPSSSRMLLGIIRLHAGRHGTNGIHQHPTSTATDKQSQSHHTTPQPLGGKLANDKRQLPVIYPKTHGCQNSSDTSFRTRLMPEVEDSPADGGFAFGFSGVACCQLERVERSGAVDVDVDCALRRSRGDLLRTTWCGRVDGSVNASWMRCWMLASCGMESCSVVKRDVWRETLLRWRWILVIDPARA
jgi:hypothetical protein